MLLNQFTAPDGALWVYAKGKPPRRSRAENECVERDFFEFELRGKKTNNSYEKWLSRIETDAASCFEAIVQSKTLGQREAQIWATFVASLFGRTRKVRAQISDSMTEKFGRQVDNPDHIRDLQCSLLKRGEFHYAEDLKRAVTEIRAAMDASPSFYHVSALPNRVRIIVESLLTRHWHTIETPANCYFLISDCPVITYEVRNGQLCPGVGFGNDNTVVLLPIGPRHLFVASPAHINWRKVASVAAAFNVNRLVTQFAHRNVYSNIRSEETRALVDTEIDTIVFGKNAFVPPTN